MSSSSSGDVIVVTDPAEVSLGICTYLGDPKHGFSAVSKARYSDFVVHEVAMDGTIARLESMEPISIDQPTKTETNGKNNDTTTTTTTVVAADESNNNSLKRKREEEKINWETIQTGLTELVNDEVSVREAVTFLQRMEEEKEQETDNAALLDDEKNKKIIMYIQLPKPESKEIRRTLHQYIKDNLSFCALADTTDNNIRIWHKSFQKEMGNKFDNNNNKRQRNNNNNNNNKFLKFVLYKENIDTGAAINQIIKRLAGGGNGRNGRGGGRGGRGGGRDRVRLGHAGNKDKRGVTTQFITLPGREHYIRQLCNIFNTSEKNNGNKDPENKSNNDNSGGGHTKSGGKAFIRVGNFQFVPNELQLGRLSGNRFDVALRNVKVQSDQSTSKEVLECAAKSIRETGFINYFGMQRFGKYHDTHLTGIAVLRGDYEGAIDIIMRPKDDEWDDVRKAREQWQNRFINVDYTSDRANVEKECAASVLKKMTRFMQSEISILNSLAQNPLDYKKAFSCIMKTMRMMFVHATQSLVWNKVANIRIEKYGLNVVEGDLVIEDNNNDTEYKNGIPNVTVVTAEDIQTGRYTIDDVVMPLLGAKTHLPENECGMAYDDILKEMNLTKEMVTNMNDRAFHCEGDYRKLICRPTDIDYEIIKYKDELQPLLQTDYMKIKGIDIDKTTLDADDKSDSLVGMVVGFTLPSSSYATIFLRELMKRPTSSGYQSELKLGGEDSKE